MYIYIISLEGLQAHSVCYFQEYLTLLKTEIDTLLWFEKVLVVSQGLNSQLLPFLLLVVVYLIMKILLKS